MHVKYLSLILEFFLGSGRRDSAFQSNVFSFFLFLFKFQLVNKQCNISSGYTI